MRRIQTKLSQKRLIVFAGFFLLFFLTEILLAGLLWAKVETAGHQGQFNLLLLGMGGAQHEASDLTDTLMVLMANRKKGEILLLSLPRDIWSKAYQTKINSLYHYGGFNLAVGEIQKIIGQPIDKVLLVDFDVFEEVIDFVGGVEVKVERTFDDFYYPIPGKEDDDCGGDPKLACRYEHLHFEAGWQTMDGRRALKFVRSRHAEGEEGTDFARNARQQKVILALKNKIFSPAILLNPRKVWGLGQITQDNIKTDFVFQDYLPLVKFFFPFWQRVRLESIVLDGGAYGGEGLLYHPKYHPSGQWVLLPVGGSWGEVQDFVEDKIN